MSEFLRCLYDIVALQLSDIPQIESKYVVFILSQAGNQLWLTLR